MLFRNTGAGAAGNDLFWRSLSGDTTRKPIAESPDYQTDSATLSPDGHWVAFATDETGGWEVYVQPFPGPGRRMAVSSGGGRNAVWHPDGTRIFYNSSTHMHEARVVLEPSFQVTRRALFAFEASQLPFFQQEFYRGWDLAPDGSHFLAVRPVGGEIPKVHVIHNWGALVRERLTSR
jgi:Tol biopolymer transport system component